MPSPVIQYLGTERLRQPARRVGRARRGMRRMPRFKSRFSKRYNVYHYKRSVFYQNIISVDNLFNYTNHWGFTLGQLPDASNFTGLYDEYKINKVVLKILPKFSQTLQSATSNQLGQILTAIDYDDANSLPQATCIDEISQYQSFRIHPGNRPVTRVIVPKVELTGSGVQAPKSRQWLDCDNTTSLHNGLKIVLPKLSASGTTMNYDVLVTHYMSFRNVL